MTVIAASAARRQPRTSRLPQVALVALLSVGVAACASTNRAETVAAVPDDYRVNHPITIEETLATLDIPVGMETRYLPRGMNDNIAGFAREFMQSGSSILAIVMPSGSGNSYAIGAVAVQIEQVFLDAGVPLASIQYRSYPSSASETNAPIRLAFARISANAGPCGPWTDNVSRNFRNEHYEAFGCATQNNLAATVSNPLDLLYPRVMPPPNAARRDTVLGAYQDGDPTATNFGGDGGAGIAEVQE